MNQFLGENVACLFMNSTVILYLVFSTHFMKFWLQLFAVGALTESFLLCSIENEKYLSTLIHQANQNNEDEMRDS